MKSATEITQALDQCSGTMHYHFNYMTKLGSMVYTDGVKMLAEMAGCYWLLDAIASHQRKVTQDEMLRHIQFWTLTVKEDHTAVLTCERDAGDIAFKEDIGFTDFPLPEIRIWLETGQTRIDGKDRVVMVAMLPSER